MARELSILNHPPKLLRGPQLLHDLIRWKDHGDTCAIDFTSNEKRGQYSYMDVRLCVGSLVSQIQDTLAATAHQTNQISSQHVVPVLLPQSPGLYISQLAILESGGAFCPINLDAPKERIKFVVGDVAAKIIITTAEFKEMVSWENGPSVVIVDEHPTLPQNVISKEKGIYIVQPADLAYVMYTSGSSGRPKGVGVSHLAVSQSLLAQERHIPQFKRFLQFAAPSFDVSVFEVFFPLTRGCTLVGCNRSQLLNDLPGMINTLEIDAVELTPTVAGSLLQKRSNAPGLKLLLTIGEMLTRPIVEEFGGSEIIESVLYGMYGPTEAAIHCSINPRMKASAKPGNIGIPFNTVSTFIAAVAPNNENAQNLKFLPLGEVGELVLGGPQLARGYLNREKQNKAAFVTFEDSFYYRTGDKARFLLDGTIEIHGRISAGQVKLRGQRVELGEVEDAVYKHSGIKTAVAVVLGSVLIVFALTDDDEILSDDVLKTCSHWLPKFMVPSEIVLLTDFPYLPSGKVDKRKLESDYQQQRENIKNESSVPLTDIERTLKDILQELLGPFPSNMRLGAAGLDSLMAIRVSSKVRSLGFIITAVTVLQADTLSTLARSCEECKSFTDNTRTKSESGKNNKAISIDDDSKDVEFTMPCTPLQSSMLAETAVDEKSYRNWVEVDFPGIVDADRVISAFHSLVAKNSVLRTGFVESEDSHGYVQVVYKSLFNTQIGRVTDFNYAYDKSKDTLQRPVRIQVVDFGTNIKVLLHIHHALYDAWSLELLLDDLETLLASETLSERPPFSVIVEGYLNGTLLPDNWSSKDYWRDHLSLLDIRSVPNFHSGERPSVGLSVARLEGKITTSSIEAAAKRLSSSPQSLFQAAYSLVLSSYLGSSDICFGTVFSGRTLPVEGIEDIVGPCLATLPIRVDVSTSSTLQDLVQELNGINRKHLEHSTLPLRDIKSAGGLHPREQLFDTLLIWQQTLHSYDHTRKHVSLVDTVDNLEFSLTFEIIPGVGNIVLKANYQQSIFPESQITLLLSQVEQLVHVIVEQGCTSIYDAFSFLGNEVLSIENGAPDIDPKPGTLSSPVENFAAEDPGRLAIEFATSITSEVIDSHRVSYGELNARANQMSHHLLSQGILPDDLICICMEKCVELYASILATAKLGAGYLPVTPDTPPERLEHILQEAKVKTVITHSSSRLIFESLPMFKVVYIDNINLTEFSAENIPSKFSSEKISYCVFTSGSTGTPKGVLVTQGNLISNLDVLEDIYPTSKSSRLLQSCSQAFDVSVFEIFFTWRIGGCLCSTTKDVLFRNIESTIRVMNITHLSLTPTVAALIDPKKVPKVKFLITAGEAVTRKVFDAWADRGLYQGYGPSETTNICTVNPEVTRNDAINNIGPPLKNTSAFVLSPGGDFALVPRGGEGELCFGGSQVFLGYMDKSQEAGKIISHPTYGRLYRSGDFGRLMPDGSLAFTGRKDDQIKIRGQRVELGEINNVMLKSNEVEDCVTMVIEGTEDNIQLLACFWTAGNENAAHLEVREPDPDIIRELFHKLESALPVYMIPSTLIPVSHIPSTVQGKIDKRLLLAKYRTLHTNYLNSTSKTQKSSSGHSWTELESRIAKAVVEITKLPLSEIEPDTSFFSLGIDSISAISLARILLQMTGYQIDISEILKHPSVVRLAESISSREQISLQSIETSTKVFDFGFEKSFVDATIDKFSQAGKKMARILPCTPLQEAMLSAAESSSKSLYRNEVSFDIHGSVERLKFCWRKMVKRHEILRTCFISTDMPRYAYAQVVLDDYDLKFDINEGKNSELEPPYSIDFANSKGAKEMIISMHHALYDGVALTVLYEEVERLYEELSLPSVISFAPFLQKMVSLNLVDADRFWEKSLKNSISTKLKTINMPPEPGQTQSHNRVQRINMSSPLSWIEARTKKHSTSLLAACHTTWVSLLSTHLQESDVIFGNVVSGRTLPIPGIERLVAPCFNTIPVRLSNIHNTTYLEAFRKLQSLNADSLPFQLTPLRRLQSNFSSDGSRLFDALFILQQPPRDLNPQIWEIREDKGVMDFPLVCEVVPRTGDDTLEIILHSYRSVISEDEAMGILKTFDQNLRAALENPRRQILSLAAKENIAAKKWTERMTKSEFSNTTRLSMKLTVEEKQIRDVIAKFTNVPVEKISRDVNIFRLGLDSISTVQIATRLRKLGHNIIASDILERPTIAQINAFLLQDDRSISQYPEFDFDTFDMKHRNSICAKNRLMSDSIIAIRPCTAVQKGMLAQTLHSNGEEYVNSIWLELLPEVSMSKFKAAWEAACAGHEMLRTGFAHCEDSSSPFVMVTYTKERFTLPWFENGGNNVARRSKELLQKPWSLILVENETKKVVRFTAHHALYDAQSIKVILEDVSKYYASKEVNAHPPVTSLLGAILRDSGNDQEAKQAFWQREENKIIINHYPDLTPLRILEATADVREVFSKSSITELEESCRKNGVTMQAAAQASWARLLAAYTGEASTTFGMTLSGRSIHGESDQISFPSIVTLPVRCDVTGTNAQLLQRTMKSNAMLHRHQFTPLTSIQKWAGYPEGKIFDTLFAYQNVSDPGEDSEIPWKIVREEASVDYAVSLEVQPLKSSQLALRLTFRKDLIPVEHAGLLLKQFDALLFDVLQHPEAACDLAPEVGDELLSITPAKYNTLPGPVSLLHEFVERGAEDWPEKKALEFATSLKPGRLVSKFWSYRELDQESNRVAQLLVRRGIVPGQIIAICFDKCAEASFAIIGILKAGCAYVALDPNAPADRLKFIIQDSGAQLIFTAGKPGQSIQRTIEKETIILELTDALAGCSSEPLKLTRAITPEDISYCLYTSGTTGTPKGCLITHENAVQAMFSFQRLFANHWTPDSKWLQFASFHFDVSVLEHFWSWSVGICVVSAPRDLIFEDIPGAIQQLGITHIDLTPSLARLLNPDEVPTLCKGVFITGGEQLKQEILDVWGEKACIYNGYGPTEATIGVTMYPRVPKNGKPSNIGPQFDNVGSFVLRPGTSLPVLRGGIGELCVSGKLVGKGYLNRSDLTTERFPTLEAFNERVYRTGDLVRILHDGSFIFLGRADDQVKLRGQRLELTEINEVIKKIIKGLQEVVTLVLKHITQQKEQLVTFFVTVASLDTDPKNKIAKMRDACKARLPGYMVPTHFIPIKALPLNANNKADSKQLIAIYNDLSVDDLHKLDHSSQKDKRWAYKEKSIVDILAKALQVDESAITHGSNIFELGLDSISIIGFSRTLQNAGLENAKLSLVKSNPSTEGLIRALLEGSSSDQGRENAYIAASQNVAAFSQKHWVVICKDLGIESREVESIAPCTPVQEGMIYRFLESEVPLYFNRFEFCLDEGVDVERLQLAWATIISQLQIMRTKFVETDDGYAQVVLKAEDILLRSPDIDYNNVDKSVALMQPFKLKFTDASSGGTMWIQIFHGLYDGNSLTMLLRSVVDEYRGFGSIHYSPSFQYSLPYGPLVQLPGAQKFWTEHLKDWSPSPLPMISESTKVTIATRALGNIRGFEVLRKRLGVSHQSILQAAWLSILHTITSPNITIGLVNSGRAIDFADADKVIGPLFNTVPFHISIENGITTAGLIEKCHKFNMQMQDFQHTPLKDIQRWSPATRGEGLFDTLFVFQRPEEEDEGFEEGTWKLVDGRQGTDYPLAFEATLNHDSRKLDLTIIGQGSVINQSQAENILEKVQSKLQEILENGGKTFLSTADADLRQTEIYLAESKRSTTPDESTGHFIWTKQAQQIRKEIATLANLSEGTIHETSSIFELGLDSIDVIKLSSRLKKQNVEIPVSIIIKCQTISKMAAKISSKHDHNLKPLSAKSIEQMSQELESHLQNTGKLPGDVEAILPATPLQQSMVKEMIRSDYKRYFNVEGFKLSNHVNPMKLVDAVTTTIHQSPILRTTFVEIEDPRSAVSYAQIVHNSKYVKSAVSTQSLSSARTFKGFMEEFRTKSIKAAITHQTLLQIRFISVGKAQYMVMAISHALYDGSSLRALHEDFARAYYSSFSPRPDYTPFLEQIFQSTTDEAKTFWKSMLSNLPTAKFPRKDPILELTTVHRLEKRSRIELKTIEALCKSSRITMQTLGQTCWALVLSQLMGQLDVVFGSVLSCRDSEEASEVMFPLMNTVVVRSVLHGSLNELLGYMQEMSDTTRQYQHFPLGIAQVYALASRENQSSTSNTTLFDTLFIYQGRRARVEKDPLYESVFGASDVEFPVCVEMEIVNDEYITWTTACKSITLSSDETERIIESLESVLERLISMPQSQTIQSYPDGISVCGLPKFRKADTQPKPVSTTIASTAGDESDWSETEVNIRKALHAISDVPETEIKKDSTIFHLGLDSILVLKLPALLRGYGIKLSVSNILKEQTVAAMSKAAHNPEPNKQELPDVEAILKSATSSINLQTHRSNLEQKAGEIQEILPVTPGQLFMIRQWQVSRGALFYPTFTYSMPGRVNKARLDRAWRQLLQRHEILRTGFIEIGKELVQVVFRLPHNDVIYRSQGCSQMRRHNLAFPPCNLILEEAKDVDAQLKLVVHHALYDGISLPILIDELQSLYRGEVLEPFRFSFKTFVAQSISASADSTGRNSRISAEDKWISYLNSDTPYETQNSDIDNSRTEVFRTSMRTSRMQQQAQIFGVSVDTLFLAAISKIQARHLLRNTTGTSIPKVIFGIYLANRAPFGEDLSQLAAPTLNLLPLLVRKPLKRDIMELAKNIQRDLNSISSPEMSSTSLKEIYEWTGVRLNYFVNILKETNNPQRERSAEQGFELADRMTERADVVTEVLNEKISLSGDGRCNAFLPSIDVEIRYHEEKIDMGVFAPTQMLDVDQANKMIDDFVAFWA